MEEEPKQEELSGGGPSDALWEQFQVPPPGVGGVSWIQTSVGSHLGCQLEIRHHTVNMCTLPKTF